MSSPSWLTRDDSTVGQGGPDPWPAGVSRWLAQLPGRPLRVAESHTAGNPTWILLSGLEIPAGIVSVDALRGWLAREADWVRTRLVHEPRGGALTCAVVPLFIADPEWDVGAVILEPGSYPPMCGHCMLGFSVAIAELGLLPDVLAPEADDGVVRILTPAGVVRSRVWLDPEGRRLVTLTNVASYPVASMKWTTSSGAQVNVELLFGGDYYLTVDARELGLRLDRSEASQIARLAAEIRASCTSRELIDPETGAVLDVYQVMFYRLHEPAGDAGSSRARVVVVAPPGVIDRSPCGTGSSALLASLVLRGDVPAGATLTTESIVGSRFLLEVSGTTEVNGHPAVIPALTGCAFLNGFSAIVADPDDDLRDGFAPL
jgi:proline racemase